MKEELNIDFGLNVTFDNNKYCLLNEGLGIEYPIGGLICEYMRLTPSKVKGVILECDGLEKEATTDNILETAMQLHERLRNHFYPVTAIMVAVEFFSFYEDWFNAKRSDRVSELLALLEDDARGPVGKFIFEDTGCSGIGGDTVLQLLLTSYLAFSTKFVMCKHMFTKLLESENAPDEESTRAVDALISMYGDNVDMQHIDYRIIHVEGKFASLYTIKTSWSLLLFEMAHVINSEIPIVKCKNCNQYFVPQGRSDAIYCSYPTTEDSDKTCKDVGAQITRANKEKNDVVTKEYRKVYMRYKMNMSRHPEDKDIEEKFNQLKSEIKIWRDELAHGEKTLESFLEWINNY